MRAFLLSKPVKYQVAIVIGLTVLLAFVIAVSSSRFFDTHLTRADTNLIASIYQVMGTIYAVLLTFTLWGVWQSYTDADQSVQKEAYALMNMVHVFEASSSWKNNRLRETALAYSTKVVTDEWPTLKNATSASINIQEDSNSTSFEIIAAVQDIVPKDARDATIFNQTLALLNEWLNARRSRILSARGNTAKALWPLLLTGAFVLFAFHGMMVTESIGIWATLLLGVSFVIGLTFYLIFTLDCPFSGVPSIDAEPFHLAIMLLQKTRDSVKNRSAG
jgi:hypothetical protein